MPTPRTPRTVEELVEVIAEETVSRIEQDTLRLSMSITDAAEVCRDVAKELLNRANSFDNEAGRHEG